MDRYPLLFGFRDLVAGRGFLAVVAVDGRALLVHEEENGYWMHGINPGGLTASGVDAGEAQRAFRETYRKVLFEIAEGASGFEDFKAEVEAFFGETNTGLLPEWQEAVRDVRAGRVEADWLRRIDSRPAPHIHVELVAFKDLEPSVNAVDEEPALAAAVGF